MFGKKVNKSKTAKRENKDFTRKTMGLLDTAIYTGTITKAYIAEKPSGAMFANVTIKTDAGKTIVFNECFQSGGKSKNPNSTFYTDSDGVDHDLPGYAVFNELLVAAMGEDILDSDGVTAQDIFDLHEDGEVERRNLAIYDWNQKKDVPTKVPAINPLFDKQIKIGVINVFVDIGTKDAKGNFVYKAGKTVPSGEVKRVNQIDKLFNIDTGQTYSEFLANEDAEFFKQWTKDCKGKVYDLTINKIAPVKDGVMIESAGSSKTNKSDTKSSLFK